MGHDISGYSTNGEELAYARYSMSNYNADLLYKAFDSIECHGGVSGNGTEKVFTYTQVKKAKEFFDQLQDEAFEGDIAYEKRKLGYFIDNCLETAKNEGALRIYFG